MFQKGVFDKINSFFDGTRNISRYRLVTLNHAFHGSHCCLSKRLHILEISRIDRLPNVSAKSDWKTSIEGNNGSFGFVVNLLVDGQKALQVDVSLSNVFGEHWNDWHISTLKNVQQKYCL